MERENLAGETMLYIALLTAGVPPVRTKFTICGGI